MSRSSSEPSANASAPARKTRIVLSKLQTKHKTSPSGVRHRVYKSQTENSIPPALVSGGARRPGRPSLRGPLGTRSGFDLQGDQKEVEQVTAQAVTEAVTERATDGKGCGADDRDSSEDEELADESSHDASFDAQSDPQPETESHQQGSSRKRKIHHLRKTHQSRSIEKPPSGIDWEKGRWQVQPNMGRLGRVYLGSYLTLEEAENALNRAFEEVRLGQFNIEAWTAQRQNQTQERTKDTGRHQRAKIGQFQNEKRLDMTGKVEPGSAQFPMSNEAGMFVESNVKECAKSNEAAVSVIEPVPVDPGDCAACQKTMADVRLLSLILPLPAQVRSQIIIDLLELNMLGVQKAIHTCSSDCDTRGNSPSVRLDNTSMMGAAAHNVHVENEDIANESDVQDEQAAANEPDLEDANVDKSNFEDERPLNSRRSLASTSRVPKYTTRSAMAQVGCAGEGESSSSSARSSEDTPTVEDYTIGAKVKVHSLKTKPDYNGVPGTIIGKSHGRIEVRVRLSTQKVRKLALKPENIELVAEDEDMEEITEVPPASNTRHAD